ncbi:Mmt2p [Saccharomyces cerevisiae x Saccharomyces kudriavzevii VIN7]|uniref:Mmt2p n=1 Tax=Saccharomyces cerevisiae x Saccharomyces kudriavzevii (strain VIN7) TaxID=1095631 RepID=H0H1T1_SACCK|nr:Mmt2p [Saccharomyces cerevisiae x Saccharomyces kudriavzevii VIN7]
MLRISIGSIKPFGPSVPGYKYNSSYAARKAARTLNPFGTATSVRSARHLHSSVLLNKDLQEEKHNEEVLSQTCAQDGLDSKRNVNKPTKESPPDSVKSLLQHTHGHSHTRLHDDPLLSLNVQQIKRNPGVRITWIGLASNVGMAVGKFIGGMTFHSQALLADSVHALSDLVSDFLTLFSVQYASRKPTSEYPYGYGKVETVGSLAVSTILTMAGISIGWSSLCAIVGPIIPHAILESMANLIGESHTHPQSVAQQATNVNAVWIAAGSILIKEWVFQATKKVAIQTNSNVLMANAWHHRVDSLTSLVALIAITSSYFFGIQSLDNLGGLVVSGLIIKTGGQGILSSLKELVDQSIPPTDSRYLEVESVIKSSLNSLKTHLDSKGTLNVKDLTILASGPNLRATTTLEVPILHSGQEVGIKFLESTIATIRKDLRLKVPNVEKVDVEFVDLTSTSSRDLENSHQNNSSHSHTHSDSVNDHNHRL